MMDAKGINVKETTLLRNTMHTTHI